MVEPAPKYLSARELAERTGYSKRFFQDLAATGIPWAVQPHGERGRLFFDAAGFEAWWQSGAVAKREPRERKPWRRSTREESGSGARSKGAVNPSVSRLEQKIDQLLKSGSQPKSKSLTLPEMEPEPNGR